MQIFSPHESASIWVIIAANNCGRLDPPPTGSDILAQQATPNTKHAGKRLLIADDDTDMRLLLAEYFRRLGFQVEERESGMAALEATIAGRFDCFIFDVSMPGMSGIELLKRVRDRGIQTPALFLTAHDALSDKVAGFEAGADDYLAKPFSPRELEYRVEALLRRGGSAPPETDGERIEVGDLVIDKRRHEVMRNGFRVDLTPLEFQILELLASEPGRAWSRNALLDRVWSTDYEGYQRNIDPHINRLRKKLETDPKNPRYVLTVRGVGYKLNEIP
jgi:two-component system alkaline phosphatase synthesis response regulator PhoP